MIALPALCQPILKKRVKKGDRAQFDGVLLTNGLLARIKTDHEKEIKLLRLGLEKLKREKSVEKRTNTEICKARVQAEKSRLGACTRDRERQRQIFTKALKAKKCPSPIWNYLSFIGGSVVAGGICIGVDRLGK